jgi:hypothetical protein
MYVFKKIKNGQDVFIHEKLGPWEGGELAPVTITWSCVFLDHNM